MSRYRGNRPSFLHLLWSLITGNKITFLACIFFSIHWFRQGDTAAAITVISLGIGMLLALIEWALNVHRVWPVMSRVLDWTAIESILGRASGTSPASE